MMYRDRQRDKAFIGAIIGAAASIAGGIIKGQKQKKAQEKAQAEAQAAQDHKDAMQNAQALTSSYANQDYVEQYNDKLTLRYGGNVRKKAAIGSLWEGASAELPNIIGGVGNVVDAVAGTQNAGQLGQAIGQGLSTAQQTAENNRINREAQLNKETQNRTAAIVSPQIDTLTNNSRNQFINKYRCGGRKKAWIGAAIGAAGSLIGDMAGNKGNEPIKVKQADASSYSAPKTGLVLPEWQANNQVVQQNTMPPTTYTNRINRFKHGGRR